MGKGVCEDCPLAAYCEAATELTSERNNDQKGKATALGALVLTREALEKIANRLECNGPDKNQNGSIVCPLELTTMMTRSATMTTWGNLSFNVSTVNTDAAKSTESRPGTYL